jgi:hypothetical protein
LGVSFVVSDDRLATFSTVPAITAKEELSSMTALAGWSTCLDKLVPSHARSAKIPFVRDIAALSDSKLSLWAADEDVELQASCPTNIEGGCNCNSQSVRIDEPMKQAYLLAKCDEKMTMSLMECNAVDTGQICPKNASHQLLCKWVLHKEIVHTP